MRALCFSIPASAKLDAPEAIEPNALAAVPDLLTQKFVTMLCIKCHAKTYKVQLVQNHSINRPRLFLGATLSDIAHINAAHGCIRMASGEVVHRMFENVLFLGVHSLQAS